MVTLCGATVQTQSEENTGPFHTCTFWLLDLLFLSKHRLLGGIFTIIFKERQDAIKTILVIALSHHIKFLALFYWKIKSPAMLV
jgi:hypothetical protein